MPAVSANSDPTRAVCLERGSDGARWEVHPVQGAEAKEFSLSQWRANIHTHRHAGMTDPPYEHVSIPEMHSSRNNENHPTIKDISLLGIHWSTYRTHRCTCEVFFAYRVPAGHTCTHTHIPNPSLHQLYLSVNGPLIVLQGWETPEGGEFNPLGCHHWATVEQGT